MNSIYRAGRGDVEFNADGSPKAFRIWKAGRTKWDGGEILFDQVAASTLLAEQAERGNRYCLDYSHNTIKPDATPEMQAAAGSFRLEVRDDVYGAGPELWAVDVRLTDRARAAIVRGEWQSISPVWCADDDGRPTSFTNCALTSIPATHNATQLAASRPTGAPKPSMTANQVLHLNFAAKDDDVIGALRAAGLEPCTAMRTVESDPNEHPSVRATAARVARRLEQRAELDARMGINTAAASVENRGRVQTFHTRGVAR